MARHEEAALWAFARGELSAEETARVDAHVSECIPCTCAYEDVKAALGALATEVPTLDGARWRAIDEKVMEMMGRKAIRGVPWGQRLAEWWTGAKRPAFAVASLTLLVGASLYGGYRLGRQASPASSAIAEPTLPAEPAPPPAAPEAAVAFARRASSGGGRLALGRVVKAGERLSIAKGGEAWLNLPDGSHAGFLSASRARFDALEQKTVSITLESGTLLVAAQPKPAREFRVEAGDVEVLVTGTRFLVERSAGGAVIAVEEGTVEVASRGQRRQVKAGRALTVLGSRWSERPLGQEEKQQFQELLPDITHAPVPLEPLPENASALPAPGSASAPAVALSKPPARAGRTVPLSTSASPTRREGTSTEMAVELPKEAWPVRGDETPPAMAAGLPGSAPPAGGDEARAMTRLEPANQAEPLRTPQPLPVEATASQRLSSAARLGEGAPEVAEVPDDDFAPFPARSASQPEEWAAFQEPGDASEWSPMPQRTSPPPRRRPMSSIEAYWVRHLETLAAQGRCRDVLFRASDWLREVQQDARDGQPPNPELYGRVVLAKVRCLELGGRFDEAHALREGLLERR